MSEEEKRFPAQLVAWDPSAFMGYSEDQKTLIRAGFMFALDRVYEAERAAAARTVREPEQELGPVKTRVERLGFDLVETGGGASCWVKKCGNGREIVIGDDARDSADLDAAEKVQLVVYENDTWAPDTVMCHACVSPEDVESVALSMMEEFALAPQFFQGQGFSFDEGQRVIVNGLPAVVTTVCTGELGGMLEVEVSGERQLVPAAFPKCCPMEYEGVEIAAEGQFLGPVKEVGPQFVVQDCGRGRMVAHELRRFDDKWRQVFGGNRVPAVGDPLFIEYKSGSVLVREPGVPERDVGR